MPNTGHGRQLTLDVLPHREVLERQAQGDPTWVQGEIKLTGELDVSQDLNAGERLLVTVADEDGQVITRGYFEVGDIGLVPIRDKDLGVIGTMRTHKAKRVE